MQVSTVKPNSKFRHVFVLFLSIPTAMIILLNVMRYYYHFAIMQQRMAKNDLSHQHFDKLKTSNKKRFFIKISSHMGKEKDEKKMGGRLTQEQHTIEANASTRLKVNKDFFSPTLERTILSYKKKKEIEQLFNGKKKNDKKYS